MLRIKDYSIKKNVHIYHQGGLNIAYDVNSGSLHVLDDHTYGFIEEMRNLQDEDPSMLHAEEKLLTKVGRNLSPTVKKEILLELEELQNQNLLFSSEAEEIEPCYPNPPLIKAICLHVAHDCNLRCRYCFAGTGPFKGRRELMTSETGKRALDFLFKHSGNRRQCEVDFFGGEPLLNMSVIKELISYGKTVARQAGKEIKFTLTTNAVLLDKAIADYLEKEGVSVVLSLDGRKEVNDKMRPFPNGKGSYENIVPQILYFTKLRPSSSPYAVGQYYYVRGTYTRYNTDFYNDVLHMADLGIKRISVEPVIASPDDDYAFREEDIDKIKESYDILGEEVLEYKQKGREFSFFHFNAGLNEGPCLPKRLSGCGAGHEYVAISPDGSIYPCHQFVGQEDYKLGTVYQGNPLKEELVRKFRGAHVYNKEDCRICWARFSCSGGCHAANAAFNGELTKVYSLGCELQKKRLEVAYYLKIKEAQQIETV
ncbi:MAG: thioether cross-link-forming SCIFF peptide maturase [Peptococcaceae bacterium]|nr:thioether cross-link-forming SCIFF peptide maturase [Peptococcaceae bacterium]